MLAGVGQTLVKVVRAVDPRVARLTVALVAPLRVQADAVVADVRVLRTLVHVHPAVPAGEGRRAGAGVVPHRVQARGVVEAGAGQTLVDVGGACRPVVSLRAPALVRVHEVEARLAARTLHPRAVVDVDVAELAREPGDALAVELVGRTALKRQDAAGCAVRAGVRGARVVRGLAPATHETKKIYNSYFVLTMKYR